MKKVILEEIENMKYLLGYKRGVVISEQTTTPAPAITTPATPIKIGVKYPSIEELQNSLNTKFQSGLTPDGKYGPKTAASVLAALQKAPTNTPETNNPPNIVVGDPNSEAIKKAAETNSPTNVASNNDTNKNTKQSGRANFEGNSDFSEFS